MEKCLISQGPVVQSWVSANPGLKFNPLFSRGIQHWTKMRLTKDSLGTSVHFKTLKTKTSFNTDMNFGKLFSCF